MKNFLRTESNLYAWNIWLLYFVVSAVAYGPFYRADLRGDCKLDKTMLAPPVNDHCADALYQDFGFATGIFYSDTIDLTEATIDAGEFFDGPIQASGLDKKTIWFSFSLSSSRQVKLSWNQFEGGLLPEEAGFSVYQIDACGDATALTVGALPSITQLGFSESKCLEAGTYYVQVCAKNEASGKLFLSWEISLPFTSDPPGSAPHDAGAMALDFGALPVNDRVSTAYQVGCQSVEGAWEFSDLPVSDPSTFVKSSWHVFSTASYFDVIAIVLESGTSVALPPAIGYRLYEGDVQLADPQSLPVVDAGQILDVRAEKRVREYLCSPLLSPNTTYSFALIFPEGYANNSLEITIGQYGYVGPPSPVPETSLMQPGNQLGILPSSEAGITTVLNDGFNCEARLSLPQNQCGTVNPATGVPYDGVNYDLTTWFSFELEEDADLTFNLLTGNDTFFYARIFYAEMSDDCASISAGGDFFADFKDSLFIPCMPAGFYALQLTGVIAHPDFIDTTSVMDAGLLGQEVSVGIHVRDAHLRSLFGLWDATAFEQINGMMPLMENVLYPAALDTFGCENTVLPEGTTCPDRPKGIYRGFSIPDSGMVHMGNLQTQPGIDFRYILYKDRLDQLAIQQNAFAEGDVLIGAEPVLTVPCIEDAADEVFGYYCLQTGDYTLVTFGDTAQVGLSDNPDFTFRTLNTKYYSRELAEDMGDILPPPELEPIVECEDTTGWVDQIPSDTIQSTPDTFSCLNNAAVVGGIPPCYGAASKLIYRQFYLSETRIVRIISSSPAIQLNLYKGKANDLTETLVPWAGINDVNLEWQTCFVNQRTHPCDPLTPGWYTVVSYGVGADYEHPAYPDANGAMGTLGMQDIITIISDPLEDTYNRPEKAYLVNDCEPVDWNLSAAADAYPYTVEVYDLDELTFSCVPDTPWAAHPVNPCHATDLYSLYMVFYITEPAFLRVLNLPVSAAIYAGDAKSDPSILINAEPVQPCAQPSYGELQLCNLQPGYYTLVAFANDEDPPVIAPRFIVERAGISRFDHANQAYDFGVVPPDGNQIWGKPGDVHPYNPLLPPSNDFIYCSTGSQPTDPFVTFCPGFFGQMYYNPLVYSGTENYPLYLDDMPQPVDAQLPAMRNLWYTFVLTEAGEVELTVKHFPITSSAYRPRVEVFRSDVNGGIPFDQLVLNGGVDSTFADGLTFVVNNRGDEQNPCTTRLPTFGFNKTSCDGDSVRYYVVVNMWSLPTDPNQQIELGIRYDGYPASSVIYDHIDEANVINGLGEVEPPYTAVQLPTGVYTGAPGTLECATRDITDPFPDTCYERSLWYKFTTDGSGVVRLAHQLANDPDSRTSSEAMKLYRETIPGDPTSLVEVDMIDFSATDSENNTGHAWREGCYEPGTYYIFWEDCLPDDFNIFLAYQPVVWLEGVDGDFCSNAIPLLVPDQGTYTEDVRINCHTIGTDFGEDGSNMDCLLGPEGYKSVWFQVSITSTEKQDMQISFDVGDMTDGEGFPINASEVRARVLYGTCDAMTAGSCLANVNTSIELQCLVAGDYYVQIVLPEDAIGSVSLTVTTTLSQDQNCQPVDVTSPSANFLAIPDCESDTIQLFNYSSAGSQMAYQWYFPGEPVNTEFLPVWVYPSTNQEQVVDVTLIVLNTENGFSDTLTQQVVIPPLLDAFPTDSISLCFCEDTTLTAPMENTTFLWNDGSDGSSLAVDQEGLYWVEMSSGSCVVRDSVYVFYASCPSFDTLSAQVCQGDAYNGVVYSQDTALQASYADACGNQVFETTFLSVMDTFYQAFSAQLCEGDTLFFEGLALTESGNYPVVLQSSEGCDSVRAMSVNVLNAIQTSETITLCQGDVFEPGGITSDTSLCETFTSVNGCDSTHCRLITFSDTSHVEEAVAICAGDAYEFGGSMLTTEGQYCLTFTGLNGCDSVHCINLEVRDTAWTLMAPEICAGDCFEVGDSCYTLSGNYINVLTSANGCDSTVLTQLTVHPGPAPQISGEQQFCAGDSVLLDAGPGFVSYNWSNGATGQTTWVSSAGTYSVLVQDGFACEGSDDFEVTAISVGAGVEVLTDYNGYAVSCDGASDASLSATGSGGIPPYQYQWSTGDTASTVQNLPEGSYQLTVTDNFGCQTTTQIDLEGPPPLEVVYDWTEPTCYGDSDGALYLTPSGGVQPYEYLLSNYPPQTVPLFSNLPAGVYEMEVRDANDCLWTGDLVLTQPEALLLELNPDTAYIDLGESVQAEATVNLSSPQVVWQPTVQLDCLSDDCLLVDLSPFVSMSYILTVQSAAGCTVRDTIYVKVKDTRKLYIPNAFSPDGNGINDYFTVFAGSGVEEITSMYIFDRWGDLVFTREHFPPNIPNLGWDGTVEGEPAAIAVYAYWVQVRYKDGSEELFKGDVHLIR